MDLFRRSIDTGLALYYTVIHRRWRNLQSLSSFYSHIFIYLYISEHFFSGIIYEIKAFQKQIGPISGQIFQDQITIKKVNKETNKEKQHELPLSVRAVIDIVKER